MGMERIFHIDRRKHDEDVGLNHHHTDFHKVHQHHC